MFFLRNNEILKLVKGQGYMLYIFFLNVASNGLLLSARDTQNVRGITIAALKFSESQNKIKSPNLKKKKIGGWA